MQVCEKSASNVLSTFLFVDPLTFYILPSFSLTLSSYRSSSLTHPYQSLFLSPSLTHPSVYLSTVYISLSLSILHISLSPSLSHYIAPLSISIPLSL